MPCKKKKVLRMKNMIRKIPLSERKLACFFLLVLYKHVLWKFFFLVCNIANNDPPLLLPSWVTKSEKSHLLIFFASFSISYSVHSSTAYIQIFQNIIILGSKPCTYVLENFENTDWVRIRVNKMTCLYRMKFVI